MASSRSDRTLLLAKGSDEVLDLYCQPCLTENQQLEAVMFCMDCHEYLCNTCYKYHKKISATKAHKLLSKADMQKEDKLTEDEQVQKKTTDVITVHCLEHVEHVLEFFCSSHDKLCCGVCIHTEHRKCSDYFYIPEEVSAEFNEGKELQQFNSDLQRTTSVLTNYQKGLKVKRNENSKIHEKALERIGAFRREIDELLDTLKAETEGRLSKMKEENEDVLNAAEDMCESYLSEVETAKVRLEEYAQLGMNNQLFVGIKQEKGRLAEIKTHIERKMKPRISTYSFETEEKVKDMTSTMSSIWSISVCQDEMDTSARHVGDVCVKADEDTEVCYINGIVMLTDSRIAVSDLTNEAIKLVDVKGLKVLSRIQLPSAPFDMKSLDNNEIAVALAIERTIEILKAGDKLYRSRTIDVRAAVSGLCFDGNHYIVSCLHLETVMKVAPNGNTLCMYDAGNDGEKLFAKPRNVALNLEHDMVYICDEEADTVTCMTVKGKVVFIARHKDLREPRGLAIGEDGSVYVCSEATNTILQFSPTGVFRRVLLGLEQGLVRLPMAIVRCKRENRLFISNASGMAELANFVRIYQLE